jgi:hypothetical protein
MVTEVRSADPVVAELDLDEPSRKKSVPPSVIALSARENFLMAHGESATIFRFAVENHISPAYAYARHRLNAWFSPAAPRMMGVKRPIHGRRLATMQIRTRLAGSR